MAYLLSNNCMKNYWNLAATVKIIVGACMECILFATQFMLCWMHVKSSIQPCSPTSMDNNARSANIRSSSLK